MLKKINYIFCGIMVFFTLSCKKELKIKDSQSEKFVKLFGGSSLDKAEDIVVSNDFVAIAGSMNTPDKGLQASFICTDKFGNEYNWSPVLIGDELNDSGNCVFKTSDGNFILVGTKSITSSNTDLLVAKISSSGSVIWSKAYGGSGKEEGLFGLELSSGGYVVGGSTESYGSGMKDVYLLKLDTDGNETWLSPLVVGAQNDEIGNDIVELNGYLYVIGSTLSYGVSNKKMYVVKIDPYSNPSYGLRIYYNYYGTNVAYSGVKIVVLPENKLLLLGTDKLNSSYLECINGDLTNSYWSKEITSSTGDYFTDLSYFNNKVILSGITNINSNINSNIDIIIRTLDNAGNDSQSFILPSEGEQNYISGAIGDDGKLFILGSNIINGLSQIFLIKKEI